jgi:drug/metabolite transporter (DMT)-like permease
MLESWKIIALFTPLFFVTYQTLAKFFPKNISVFLVNAYASLVGFFIMLLLHLLFSTNKSLALNSKTMFIAIGAGIFISTGNFFLIKAYTAGAPQSLFAAILYSLLIIYSLAYGLVIWHEKLSFIQIFGVLLSMAGVFLIAYFRK